MEKVKSVKGLQKKLNDLPEQTQEYLRGLKPLVESAGTYPAALAFAFMKLEEGNHRALKCGLIRIHHCNTAKVDDALAKQHFTRDSFRIIFKNVFSENLKQETVKAIQHSEIVRDKLIHGKSVAAPELRDSISGAITYMSDLGSFVEAKTNKNPFDLRGLNAKMTLLKPTPSYWLLKGIGFYNGK